MIRSETLEFTFDEKMWILDTLKEEFKDDPYINDMEFVAYLIIRQNKVQIKDSIVSFGDSALGKLEYIDRKYKFTPYEDVMYFNSLNFPEDWHKSPEFCDRLTRINDEIFPIICEYVIKIIERDIERLKDISK